MVDRSKHIYPQRVEVSNTEQYGSQFPPSKFIEAVKWFQEKLDVIPEEYRESAMLDIDSYTEYDSARTTLEIYYYRPPTEEEIILRMAQAKFNAERELEHARQNLARLQKQVTDAGG